MHSLCTTHHVVKEADIVYQIVKFEVMKYFLDQAMNVIDVDKFCSCQHLKKSSDSVTAFLDH